MEAITKLKDGDFFEKGEGGVSAPYFLGNPNIASCLIL